MSDTKEWCKIRRKTDFLFQKWQDSVNFTWALEILKISTLIGSFCAKYRGVIFHDAEEWCKIWRKTDLWFGKWHEEYDKFSPEHLKNLKIGTLMGSFYPKKKMYELKIYRGVFSPVYSPVPNNSSPSLLIFGFFVGPPLSYLDSPPPCLLIFK